ncbi:hypothetical protein [Pedobacter nototheniae]|uniref:hypothetical protein n=1 Tax=Pedobacter nototheniae TaxID=2488994 RepID=UPI00103D2712|nr:hypothetical protein [Pedobacter nototheniae]
MKDISLFILSVYNNCAAVAKVSVKLHLGLIKNVAFLLLMSLSANSQNISNPNFEIFSACPNNQGQLIRATGWTQPTTLGTPDYFNVCTPVSGSSLTLNPTALIAQNGTGFAGAYAEVSNTFTNYKEYLTNRLSAPLIAGITYRFSFYVAHLNGASPTRLLPPMTYVDLPAAEQGYIGAVFSTSSPSNTNTVTDGSPSSNAGYAPLRNSFGSGRVLIPASNTAVYGAESRNAWVQVTLEYTAVGGEEYMTIGQLREGHTNLPTANAVYYLYDNFSSALESTDCTQLGNFDAPGETSKTGISDLVGFTGGTTGWPANVSNGFIVIESKKKGFVITRVSSSSAITNPVEGMLIYDIGAACVKLYNGTSWKCLEKDCNP